MLGVENHTIAAIATPPGSGGIGVIKISGANALPIVSAVFRKANSTPSHRKEHHPPHKRGARLSLKSRRLYYGHVTDPDTGKTIDEVLVTLMKAPRTYTREDVVEIQAHSGSVGLRSIMELVLRQGARLADPGEFTKRAFINGRIDLTQAEAVIDVINAKTKTALKIAASQLNGQMKVGIETMRSRLLEILTEIEAGIDFPEDISERPAADKTIQVLEKHVRQPLDGLIKQCDSATMLRDGLRLAIVGRPNVGKSSLLNRLVQKDRAIVASIPGTTRDVIEETFSIQGIPILIMDTAGLHETRDPIEVMGINKAHESIEKSDLILFMVDCSQSLTPADRMIYRTYQKRKMIIVVNKIDLIEDDTGFDVPNPWGATPRVRISALHDIGISHLKDSIETLVLNDFEYDPETLIIPNIRHKQALVESLEAVSKAIQGLRENRPYELIAIDVQQALDRLGEVIGINVREDVVDQIFSRFCIGK
ncbi:MAG: tRNA uridine-5-carboxymethylaminomethyl(34) synthesis GTPase MnmE [Desulfobacterales bacterium]|jgi:tRNA modification GTPase